MNIINCISENKKKHFIDDIEKNGFSIIEIDNKNASNLSMFYEELISILPIGIPLSGAVHWDAFLDSVWEGITEQESKKIALIWNNAQVMLNERLADFLSLVDVFTQLSRMLTAEDPNYSFITVIIGNEKKFL